MGTEWFLSVLAVYPCDHMTYRELWLAAAHYHERVPYDILLAQEKIKMQNLKYGFY